MTPEEKKKFKDFAQIRSAVLAPLVDGKRLDTERYVEGYAAKYAEYLLYEDEYGKTFERFEPGCFDHTDMSDIILQYDHQGRVYARTTNNTLIVEADGEGLFIAADLDKTEGSRALYDDIAAGLITKMSWRFRVGEYRIEKRGKDCCIVHTSIPKIYDVSAVSIPANNDTEINARDFIHGVMDEEARREAELDDQRRKLRLRIKMEGFYGQNH